ncbi:polyprenyl synthetase family protein [Streptomyces sp. NBC_01498]|uniref:polyprenyl synthetase family protein n=1 Tax=Streptomyces sp. NBC_01498 TaxID=2975870 RepID=UPI002E7BDACE|nr:polyprenyl synthetase family protein [Streptomyces sp. NBC_01498]WTL23306.1 polyprenyl synthetase family protein [Streptomyces sp. NBC_01498]
MRRTGAGTRPSEGQRGTSRPDGPPTDGVTRETVDHDVAAAVERELAHVLADRVRDAAETDAVFARDVAQRVADFTLRGGRRIRSQFLWWGLRACGGDGIATGPVLRVAAGLELIQTCALVHDDVMDGSPLRRGRPAVHTDFATHTGTAARHDTLPGPGARPGGAVPFGTAAAVLVGDLALAWADDTLGDADLAPGPRLRVHEVWRAMRTEMVAGQYLDLHNQATGSRSAVRAIRAACLKTALYTVERPLALGAALAGADETTSGGLRAAGRCAGIAFQLRDDLLGVFGDPAATGKPSGDDIREGKLTYLVAVARARAEAHGDTASRTLLDGALGDRSLSEGDMDLIRTVLVDTGAKDHVDAKIERLAAHSARRLAAVPLDPAARHRLGALFHAVTGATGPAPPAAGPDPRAALLAASPGGGR